MLRLLFFVFTASSRAPIRTAGSDPGRPATGVRPQSLAYTVRGRFAPARESLVRQTLACTDDIHLSDKSDASGTSYPLT